jgi:hypothetical protein
VLVPGTVEEGAESDDGAEHEHADEHREPVAEGCGPGARRGLLSHISIRNTASYTFSTGLSDGV